MPTDREHCPECGSLEVVGLVKEFWVSLDPEQQQKTRWQEESKIGTTRICDACSHEWESE